jgi:hypothetical protein
MKNCNHRRQHGEIAQAVMVIPTAAAVMTPNVAQPRYLSNGEFTRLPITLWLLVRRMTSGVRSGTIDHSAVY